MRVKHIHVLNYTRHPIQLTLPAIPIETLSSSSLPVLSAPSSFPSITFLIISSTTFPGFKATNLVKKFTCTANSF